MPDIRLFREDDLEHLAFLYQDYFNQVEEAAWTIPLAIRRLRQLFFREDNLAIVLEEKPEILGFAVGQLVQFDDGVVFELNELFVARLHQNKGHGSLLLKVIESMAKQHGAFRIQLITGVDERHRRFYNVMHGYGDGTNNVQKSKALE